MFTQILDILSRHSLGMSLTKGLETAREIESLVKETAPMSPVRSLHTDEIPLSVDMIRAAGWAERVFSATDIRTKKIQCIKVLRNEWNLGLKNAKDIIDNVYGSARESYWD